MKEGDSQIFVIKEEEQLLDVVTEDFADDGQSLRIVNLEDNQDNEQLLMVVAESEDSEDCVEFVEEIPSEMLKLYHELSILEERLDNQRIHIQVAKTE